MPVTTAEQLEQLVAATNEAKATIRELHEARSAARDVLKDQRKVIVDSIERAVAEVHDSIRQQAHDTILDLACAAVDDLAAKLRERLSL